MIYILLDTNIILDMVVDRRNSVIKGDLLKTFIKLLDYGEVKLILPNVVKVETYRHLDEEFSIVEDNIDKAKSAIKGLYGISTYDIDSFDLSVYKKNAIAELTKAYNQFQQNKQDYHQDIQDTINLLFTHRNTILIEDNELMPKVLHRRIYKRAPFHKEAKESYGDGTITETLINIQEWIKIESGDTLFFVTGNYQDFSYTEKNKDNLHPHIVEDLQSVGLASQLTYVRSFGNLIHPHLEQNIENADLVEEFEAEMREEEENFYREQDDDLRESVGLTALGSFVSQLEDRTPESQFAEDVIEQFERLNSAYGKLEELSAFYEDELYVDDLDCTELVGKFAGIVGCEDNPTVENLKTILHWIEEKKNECAEIDERVPDYVSLGEDIEFWDVNRANYYFCIYSLDYLTPANGETDSIRIRIVDKDKHEIAEGSIDITYGFIEEDPFDGIGDGYSEDIEYNTDPIIEKLKEISDEWDAFIDDNEGIIEQIRAAMGM